MPQEIYNEGRVVGLSAYELYLRHQLSEYPELEPLTEREWLASTLGNGASMILRIPKGTSGLFEKQLPDKCALCAATSITACVFDGTVALDARSEWGTRITSYGPLISNTKASHPVTPGDDKDTVPWGVQWSKETHAQLKEYMKIVDGLVYQPGEWKENSNSSKNPYMDFTPDLHSRGMIRLNVSKALEHDVYIILHGWVHRSAVGGASKLDAGALADVHPYNGDFLGVERYPWAVKVLLTVPTGLMHVLNDKAYIRKLPATDTNNVSVTAKSIVDTESVNLQTFYSTNDTTTYTDNVSKSKISVDVTELNVTGDGASVIAAHQRKDISQGGLNGTNYPPILYGAKVTNTGQQSMVPLDVGAPGTVKVFDAKAKATNYPKIIPNTYALWHDKTNKDMYFVEGNEVVPMTTKLKTQNLGTASAPKFTSIATSGNTEIRAVSLVDDKGTALNTSGSGGTIDASAKNLTWTDLLTALGANKAIDVIGANLNEFRKNLPNIVSGTGGILDIKGTGLSSIAGRLAVGIGLSVGGNFAAEGYIKGEGSLQIAGASTLAGGVTVKKGNSSYHFQTTDSAPISFNKAIKSGANYIEFDQGSGKSLRLYVSSTQPDPASVPEGSIGIGW